MQDVNVFLYDVRGIARPQHFYVRGDVLECSVPVGEYEVYAVANLHEDMGAMDREELLAYEFRVPRSYASLPMSRTGGLYGRAENAKRYGLRAAQCGQDRLQHLP